MPQNLYDFNEDPQFLEAIVEDIKSQLDSNNYPNHLLWLRDFVPNKLNINDSFLTRIPLYLPDENENSNQNHAFQQSHLWLNPSMDELTKSLHLQLMENLMYKALTELYKKYPKIVKDVNKLTSSHLMEDTPAQYRKKLFSHQEDWFIPELYPELSLPLKNKSEFSTEEIIKAELLLLLIRQAMNFIDHSETTKRFGFTITSETIDNQLVPWYKPVILCLHEPSKFCCMVDINNLALGRSARFTSGFALDNYQAMTSDLFRLVGTRMSSLRVFDDIVNSINFDDIINKTANLEDIHLPPSFIEFRDSPRFQEYVSWVKKLQSLDK